MYMYIYLPNSNGYNQQAGKANTNACSLTHTQKSEMETLPEAHGRSAEQSQTPEGCIEIGYGRLQRRRARSQSDSTSSSLMRDLSSLLSLSFIAQGGRPLSPPLHRINSVLSNRDTLRFSPPIKCILPRTLSQPACTYLIII